MSTQIYEIIKQNKIRKQSQPQLGRPEGTAAREQRWRDLDNGAAHAGLPPQPRRLTRWTRTSAREIGERRKTTAGLAVGGFSGETNGATVLTTAMHI